MTLMALAIANRYSDLVGLDRDHLRWTPSGIQCTVVRLTKICTPGSHETVHYSSRPEDAEVCPATTLRLYLSRTTE